MHDKKCNAVLVVCTLKGSTIHKKGVNVREGSAIVIGIKCIKREQNTQEGSAVQWQVVYAFKKSTIHKK